MTCHALVEGVDDRKLRDKLMMKACEGPLTLAAAIKMEGNTQQQLRT